MWSENVTRMVSQLDYCEKKKDNIQFPACGEKCLPSMGPCLEKLQDCIASLTRELTAVSATRDAKLMSLRNDLLSTREKVNQLESVVGCGVLVQP